MRRWHADAELAPRDVVARGVFAEIAAGHHAFLDARQAIGAAFAERFPTVAATCRSAGIDPVHDLIPVTPAEHYHMGGVSTDKDGRTSIPGLWAAGEVASTGVHGANRLASNSLLEAVVFAARVAEDIKAAPPPASVAAPSAAEQDMASGSDADREQELRTLMAAQAGVIRNEAGLARALAAIARTEREATSPEIRNMATTALLVAAAAWQRRESRGAHFRSDHPKPDPAQARRSFLTLATARALAEEAGRSASPSPVAAC
jgi:L-aspartate oxidase